MQERKTYRSNYEFPCARCGQPIKAQTDYLIEKAWDSKGVLRPKRIHVECGKDEL